MTITGPAIHTVHVAAPGPLSVRLTNEDPYHCVAVDLYRVQTGREGRMVLDPLESVDVALAPGDVELKLGRGARLETA